MGLMPSSDTLLATIISALGRIHLSSDAVGRLSGWSVLVSILGHGDHRVVANALETLSRWRWLFSSQISASQFASLIDVGRLSSLTKSESSRVVANALVVMGYAEISKELIKKLEQGLRSKKPATAASTRYALREIAAYYRDVDPVYLRTQVAFCRLLDETAQKASA